MLNHNKQSGVILPTVLWIVLICLVVAANYATDVRLSIKTLANTKDTVTLNYAARAGIYVGLSNLLQDNRNTSSAQGEWIYNGKLDGSLLRVNAKSEVSSLALNQVDEDQIVSILSSNGIEASYAMSIAQRIIDWRDKDSQSRSDGMEDYDYYASGYKYGSKDEPFADFEELKLVSGVNETIFQILKNNLTLFPISANRIIRLSSEAIQPDTSKSYRIIAVVHLTGDKYKPYRFIKWSAGSEII